MNLYVNKVEGINEPVKLIAASGFAVGARTEKIYAWAVEYENQDEDEDYRQDGVEEEAQE